MRKVLLILCLVFVVQSLSAQGKSFQKIDSIVFNLYTDSLKKGFYNYISVDGKFSTGEWQPLDTTHVRFLSDAGFFKGNDIFIDSTFTEEKVKVKVILKSDPRIWKETTIYIRKRGFDEPLKSDQEILDEMRESVKKKKS